MRESKDISRRQLISMVATLRGHLAVPALIEEDALKKTMRETAFNLSPEDGEWFEPLEEVPE